jgi:hypothetical protein
MTLALAWEQFDKAVRFEEKAKDPSKAENMKRIALRAADKALDEAVKLEAAALAAGERHT